VHDADPAVRRLHFDRERQPAETFDEPVLRGLIEIEPPAALVAHHPPREIGRIGGCIQYHVIMIAEAGMEPRPADPFERGEGIRPAVDQIAHRQTAIARGIETDALQFDVELTETAVDVADHEVATFFVPVQSEDFSRHGLSVI
jgi:hypothetical protein